MQNRIGSNVKECEFKATAIDFRQATYLVNQQHVLNRNTQASPGLIPVQPTTENEQEANWGRRCEKLKQENRDLNKVS